MKVFLDTNVLASAIATRGLCTDVLREVLATHELIVSEALLKELKRVLQKKFKVPSALISDFLNMLSQYGIPAKPVDLPRVNIKDQDDLVILAAAICAGADVLVTGDKELQRLAEINRMKIVSPRGFWELLKG